jgi:hypothetical protein
VQQDSIDEHTGPECLAAAARATNAPGWLTSKSAYFSSALWAISPSLPDRRYLVSSATGSFTSWYDLARAVLRQA